MIVGLTGGIGSGKSTVARMFASFGVPVFDSDKEAKKLMNTNKNLVDSIKLLFGELAYKDGQLNRVHIASLVFKDQSLLQKLNKIVHPVVREHFALWAKQQDFPYVLQETALIFENQMEDHYDKIVLVTAPIEVRVSRVIARDLVTKESVLERVKNQWDDSEKISKSDYVIQNLDLKTTHEKVEKIHSELLNQET